MDNRKRILYQSFEIANIPLTDGQGEAFLRYASLLEEWNAKMNLTAITAFEDVVQKHFVDSVFPFLRWAPQGGKSLMDVGTGAGFPGIPLKIMYPELSITLLDSLNKRVQFLSAVIAALGLEQISAIHGRAEDLGRQEAFREQYDYATARAVAALPVLSELCSPFVKPGGHFLAYKSDAATVELQQSDRALDLLALEEEKAWQYHLPGTEAKRVFLVIKKAGNTPPAYPRKAGSITKKPL